MMSIKFKSNRVWRVYEGGLLLERLKGEAKPQDAHFPEEWIASTVKACNAGRKDPLEGLSVVDSGQGGIPFTEMLAGDPEALLGKAHVAKFGAVPGFLTKFLDSAIRLPLQAHPDRAAAKRLYNSSYGKTEAWLILGVREGMAEPAHVLYGFNEGLDEAVFRRESLTGSMPESLKMMHKHYVKPGDVLMIRGGMPHAIGPGIFLLEIMEPSDWVVQPEDLCGDCALSVQDRFGSVDPAASLDVFHYKPLTKENAWAGAAIKSSVMEDCAAFTSRLLIDREKERFFGAIGITVRKEWSWRRAEGLFAAGVVTSGSCEVEADGTKVQLRAGDAFFVPASCVEPRFKGSCELILALPPC